VTSALEELLEHLAIDGVAPRIPFADPTGARKSPCLACIRKDEDKNRCSQKCKRLFAYRLGRDYAGLPVPDKAQLMEEPDMPNKQSEQKERLRKRVTCQVPGCDRPHSARGFCSAHWSAWRHGKLPEFGEYAPAGTSNSVKKTDENKESTGDKEAGSVYSEQKPAAITLDFRPTILVDFRHAQDLWREIERTAKKLKLPMEHVTLTLIAQGLRAIHTTGDRSA
jgi:hypothetical protein